MHWRYTLTGPCNSLTCTVSKLIKHHASCKGCEAQERQSCTWIHGVDSAWIYPRKKNTPGTMDISTASCTELASLGIT